MTNALLITVIGMGLVFVAILALWGLMAALVKVTDWYDRRSAKPEEAPEALQAEREPAVESVSASERKRRAAAAATAVAMALSARTVAQPERASDGNAVSAWQAVLRANQLEQRGIASRKKVVR